MSATYNLYAIVLLVGIVPCVAVALALAVRAMHVRAYKHRTRDVWLAGWLSALVLLIAPYLLGFAGAYDRVGWLSNTPIANPFLLGATTLGYTLALARPKQARRAFWLLVPVAIVFGVGLWIWVRSTWGGVAYGDTAGPAFNRVLGSLGELFSIGCLLLAIRLALGRPIPKRAAPADVVTRRWLRRFLAAAGAVFTVSVGSGLAYTLGADFSYERQWWAHVAYVTLGYYVAGSGYGAHRALDATLQAVVPNTPAAPPLLPAAVAEWRVRLEGWMREHQPHLRPDLTLAALAEDVGLTAPELSHVVNAGFGQNVSEFINGYRVREVQARLLEPEAERLTLLAVALESGFRSKATFNRAFRRAAGTTPSAWWAANRDTGAARENAPAGSRSPSETGQKTF